MDIQCRPRYVTPASWLTLIRYAGRTSGARAHNSQYIVIYAEQYCSGMYKQLHIAEPFPIADDVCYLVTFVDC